MERQFFAKDNAPPKVTEEERKESRRQEGLLGVKLNNKKFYCEKKLTDTCQHFFHGRAKSSDGAFHKFLQACYDKICEIYEKRLATSKAAREADQDNSKRCEAELKQLQKEQSARSADRILLEQQKVKKTQPPFDRNNFKTWSGLDHEDAERSRSNLTEKKTGLLQKVNDIEKQISQLKVESEAFQKKINELKRKLDAASSEAEYKDIRLTFDYNQLQVEKLQAKIKQSEQQKADIEAELNEMAIKPEELCDALCLKADAENYFL
jgi:predicted  nucleic acid-binding Zn-ribbon protein